MRRVLPACFAFILILGSFAGRPAIASQQAQDFLELIGYDTYIEGFVDSLVQSDGQLGGDGSDLSIAWDLAASTVFVPSEMIGEVVVHLDETLKQGDLEAAVDFYQSDLGRLVTEMEVKAQAPGMAQEADARGAEILADLIEREDDRLEAYTGLIEALGALDSGVVTAMNLNFAIYDGMSRSGRLPYQLSEAEILNLVSSQQEKMRSQIRNQLYISFAYTYRDLSDEDLAKYVAFLISDTGRAVYGSLELSMERVLSQRARDFGGKLAEFQGIQEL